MFHKPTEHIRLAHKSLKNIIQKNYMEQGVFPNPGSMDAKNVPEFLSQETLLREVYQQGEFTVDWFSINIPRLYTGIKKSGQIFQNILEIGSFEGLSTCWFSRLLELNSKKASITTIDVFNNKSDRGNYESRYDKNIKKFIRNVSVNKIKSESIFALPHLLYEKSSYDLIYVDGSHDAHDVIIDASFGWKMLNPGGVIIFDDYYYTHHEIDKNVLEGVNAFLDIIENEYSVLNAYYQIILQKI